VTAVARSFPLQDTDAAVIGRSVREPEQFAAIFDRYYPRIHGYLARRLGKDLADDLASETFLLAFAARDRYDTRYPDARPWLYGIAAHLIARQHRAEQRWYRAIARAGMDQVAEGHDDRVAGQVDAAARRGALAAALAGIPDVEREVLLLVAWAELSSEEVARALGIPAGTVRSRLYRARRQLRIALDLTDREEDQHG
jgi:RNA polymerase sigma-70 factor (ECF subfamily)